MGSQIDIIPYLPNAMVCSMGMAEQTNYHLDGTTTTKNRLTHDQAFHILENSQSANDLTDLSRFL
jgi:hypothetical protein